MRIRLLAGMSWSPIRASPCCTASSLTDSKSLIPPSGTLAFNPKYEDPESQEGHRAAVLALADEAVASVRNYRSGTPEQPFVEAWLRRATDDFRFQVMAILYKRKVKSPWARRE